MSGDEARGLLFGLLESDKIQLRKYPDMPSMRRMIADGRVRYDAHDPQEHWKTYKELSDEAQKNGIAYGDCEDLAVAVAAEDQVFHGVQSLPYAYTPKEGLFHVVTAVPGSAVGGRQSSVGGVHRPTTDDRRPGTIPFGFDGWPVAMGADSIPGYVLQDPSRAAGMGSSFGYAPEVGSNMSRYGASTAAVPVWFSEPRLQSVAFELFDFISQVAADPDVKSATKMFEKGASEEDVVARYPRLAGMTARLQSILDRMIRTILEVEPPSSQVRSFESYMDHAFGPGTVVFDYVGPENASFGSRSRLRRVSLRIGPFRRTKEMSMSRYGAEEPRRRGLRGALRQIGSFRELGAGVKKGLGLESGWERQLGEQLPGRLGVESPLKPKEEAAVKAIRKGMDSEARGEAPSHDEGEDEDMDLGDLGDEDEEFGGLDDAVVAEMFGGGEGGAQHFDEEYGEDDDLDLDLEDEGGGGGGFRLPKLPSWALPAAIGTAIGAGAVGIGAALVGRHKKTKDGRTDSSSRLRRKGVPVEEPVEATSGHGAYGDIGDMAAAEMFGDDSYYEDDGERSEYGWDEHYVDDLDNRTVAIEEGYGSFAGVSTLRRSDLFGGLRRSDLFGGDFRMVHDADDEDDLLLED